MIMRINTQNVTMPWESYPTPINSPAYNTTNLLNNLGTDQELPCQYTNREDFPALHVPSQSIIGSQPALFGPQELPDLPHAQVQPLMLPDNLAHHSDVAGYDSPTSHLFASPIWPHDESLCSGSFEISNAANEVDITSGWDFLGGLESLDQSFSQTRGASGTTVKMPSLQSTGMSVVRRRKEESNIELPVALGRNIHGCGVLGCGRTYRRIEHLKRHIRTYHNKDPESFSCEFCGKNDFSRGDNLRIHRMLHARQPRRNARVQFVPEAVLIIEEEMRSRQARSQPSTSRMRLKFNSTYV